MTILPTSIIFYILLGVMVKLKDYDDVIQPPDFQKINHHGHSNLNKVNGVLIDGKEIQPDLSDLKGGRRSLPLPKSILDFFRHKS